MELCGEDRVHLHCAGVADVSWVKIAVTLLSLKRKRF